MKVTVFDYGAGNLHSLTRAIEHLGHSVRCEDSVPRSLVDTDCLVLPGVGAFGHAASRLAPGRLDLRQALIDGLPCVGICLGMQLLLESSEEDGHASKGLGLLPGRVRRLASSRVPHMGWEKVTLRGGPESVPAPSSPYMYFAHSYVCEADDLSCVAATSKSEEQTFAAVVRKKRVLGVQCHPEKSSHAGVEWLGALLHEVTR